MGNLLGYLALAAEKTPDEEGKDIILSMLVVGLIFVAVVVLGEIAHRIATNRRR
jgi:hypothetical protein